MVFVFGVPIYVCFNCAKNSNLVCPDELACVDPFVPVIVGVDSACVLKCNTKARWLVGTGDGGDMITPCGSVDGGRGCLLRKCGGGVCWSLVIGCVCVS